MKLGMNMLLWTTDVTEQHSPLFGRIAEIGFDGAEVMIGDRNAAHYAAIGRELDRCGLERTAVAAVGAEHNPASPDRAVREAALARLVEITDKAREMGADRVVGPFHSAYKEFTGRGPTEDELAWSAETLAAAAEHAVSVGAKLAIEPLNRFECYLLNTAGQGAEMVRRVGHPGLTMLYDTHHMHLEERDVGAAIRGAAGSIGHVHISENDRGVPGRGQVDWEATFAGLKAIGYDDWLVIEAFSRLDPDFARMIHVWRDFFADPEEVMHEGHAFVRKQWSRA